MRLAIVFDVPDDAGVDYARVAARMVEHHDFAVRQQTPHWSFDLNMRPVAAVAIETDETLVTAAKMARQELDQEHPWIPGAVFRVDGDLKPALIALLSAIIPATPAGDLTTTEVYAEATREGWARKQVADAGKSWDTHRAKFSGAVLPRD